MTEINWFVVNREVNHRWFDWVIVVTGNDWFFGKCVPAYLCGLGDVRTVEPVCCCSCSWCELAMYCWCLLQQTTEPAFPETLLIAINKQGVNLIDPVSKVSDYICHCHMMLCERGLCRHEVSLCVSICLSVTFVQYILSKQVIISLKFFTIG